MLVIIARILVIIATATIGICCQLMFWKTESKTVFQALLIMPFLWFVYLLVGVLVGEHVLRILTNRELKKQGKLL